MKKFLSLVLALVMTMSLVTISAGAKDYKDSKDITYNEAVDVLSTLGVLEGDDNGFRPTGTLKRSEAAKIICYLNLTPKTAATLSTDTAPFADVPASHWAAGYIAECVSSGILAGVGGGKFAPDAEVTGYEFLKMLLVSLGYDAAIEGLTGATWAVNVAKLADELKLTKGNDDFVGSKDITREEAALYALNTLQAKTVTYTNKGTNITIDGVVISTGAGAIKEGKTFMAENYSRLKRDDNNVVDAYGRPAVEWTYKGESVGTYAEEPVLVYTESVKGKDIKADLKAEGYKYTDAKKTEIKDDTYNGITGNGKVVEFYGATKTGDAETADVDYIAKVVTISTYIAKVDSVKTDRASTKDKDEREIKLNGVTLAGLAAEDDDVVANFEDLYGEVEKGNYILYTVNEAGKTIVTAEIAESVEGKITRTSDEKIVLDGETYELAAGKKKTDFALGKTTVYFDSYGYAILSTAADPDKSDAVYLTAVFKDTDKWNTTTYTAQIVTAEGEIEELELDKDALKDKDGKIVLPATKNVYTYTTDDGEATLTPVAAKNQKDLKGADLTDKAYVVVGGSKIYFADEVAMVYMKKVGTSKMSITTANKVEKYNKLPANSCAVLNKDGDIETIFVAAEPMTVVDSDKIIYVADAKVVAEEEKNNIYEAYIEGEKEEIAVSNKDKVEVGFYTYSITDDVYKLTKVDAKKIGTVDAVYRDTYLNIVGVEGDFVLDKNAVVIDLSKNDITDAADLAAAMKDAKEDEKVITAQVVYDLDDEVVTVMVVNKAVDKPVEG